MLTLKQKELLDFIVDYFNSKNIYPTFDRNEKIPKYQVQI